MDSDEGELVIDEGVLIIDEGDSGHTSQVSQPSQPAQSQPSEEQDNHSELGASEGDSGCVSMPLRNPLFRAQQTDSAESSPIKSLIGFLNTTTESELSEGEIRSPKKKYYGGSSCSSYKNRNNESSEDFDIYDDDHFLSPKKSLAVISEEEPSPRKIFNDDLRPTATRKVSPLSLNSPVVGQGLKRPFPDEEDDDDGSIMVKVEHIGRPSDWEEGRKTPGVTRPSPPDTPDSPDPEPERAECPPESPPSQEATSFSRVTRVRVEVDDDEPQGAVGYAIDCMGTKDRDERPSTSSSTDFNRRDEDVDYRDVGSSRKDFLDWDAKYRERTERRSDPDNGRYDQYDVDYRRQQDRDDRPYSSRWRDRDSQEMPLYDVDRDVMFDGTPGNKRRRSEETESGAKRPKNCCWNCKGDHMITECTEPKDGRRIAANRKIFMAQKNRMTGGSSEGGGRTQRYHEENNQRFSKYKPGTLSLELRQALGIKHDEVPPHVYRMRVYGYPPGYLEVAAEEANSGLKLYGDHITMAYASRRRQDTSINPDSIIAYPGYNVPMPEGQEDMGRYHGYPRYSMDDSVENFLTNLNQKGEGEGNIPVQKDDGIRSVSSQRTGPSPWEYNNLRIVDRPVLNDSARHGIGRGKAIEQAREHKYKQKRQHDFDCDDNFVQERNMQRLARDDAYCRKQTERGNEIIRNDIANAMNSCMDSRYLPTQPPRKMQRPNPVSSPSLLGNSYDFEPDGPNDEGEKERSGSSSPVILNLPAASSSSSSSRPSAITHGQNRANSVEAETWEDKTENEKRAVNCGGSDTASSGDFQQDSVKSKSSKGSKKLGGNPGDSDSDVVILGDSSSGDDDDDSDDSSVCLIGEDSSDVPTKTKVTKVLPKQAPSQPKAKAPSQMKKSTLPTTKKSDAAAPTTATKDPDVVQLDDDDEENGGAPSPGSSTGDEALMTEIIQKATTTAKTNKPAPAPAHANAPRKEKSCWGNLEENWEDGSDDNDKTDDENGQFESEDVQNVSEKENKDCNKANSAVVKEFIPGNPMIATYKDVLLKNAAEDKEPPSTDPSFKTLPSSDKFAQGMPQMVFEEDAPQRTGRLDKVLSVLKSRKTGGGESSK